MAVLASLVGCKVEHVEEAPATAIGNKFFSALKTGDGEAALALFAPEFRNSEKEWPNLLMALQDKFGVVSSAELLGATMAAKDDSPCYVLAYSVKRGSSASDETLFVCRSPNAGTWAIVGQSLVRLDTNQSITGGVMPVEVGVHVP